MRLVLTLVLLVAAAALLAARPHAPDRGWMKGVGKPGRQGPAIAGLPDSHGRSFTTLDAYLAHLRAYAATIDRPWYREIAPNLYRRETGNLRTGTEPRQFTREDLERRFGFRK